jgi:glucose-6-phosphate 1-dehydrogenase
MLNNNGLQNESQSSIGFIIFGVTGDLAKRKLIPALYELFHSKSVNVPVHIIGFARRDWDTEVMRQMMKEGVMEFGRNQPINKIELDELMGNIHFIRSTFNDPDGYKRLGELIDRLGIPNLLFYLATPPESYIDVIRQIGNSSIHKNRNGWIRIVIEKPYGRDLRSAQELEVEVHLVFKENQIFRIDHYLGKETVQNILVFRFSNGIFEPIWNRTQVDHIQITVAETMGVGTRAGYYETAGVIRDMFQNHLLQLLSLTAMEAPVTFNADSVRDEKVKVLKALRPITGQEALQNTYRAQYVSGVSDGKRVLGYKDEKGVSANSITETCMVARLFVDNWRWSGVPFYLRSGKRLPSRATEIAIFFKQAPLSLFNWINLAGSVPNVLAINIQPDEGITLSFGAKIPGSLNNISPVRMVFNYQQAFGGEPPEAYERLLLDCLIGDATLFTRSDEVQAQWLFTSRILDAWMIHPVNNLPVYEAGTWGPPGMDDFINRDGKKWRIPDISV